MGFDIDYGEGRDEMRDMWEKSEVWICIYFWPIQRIGRWVGSFPIPPILLIMDIIRSFEAIYIMVFLSAGIYL